MLTPENFFNKYTFFCTVRFKKSGSSPAAKWVDNYIPKEWSTIREGSRLYVTDSSLIGEKFTGFNTQHNEKTCYVNDSKEIRILSDTKNLTYIFSVE